MIIKILGLMDLLSITILLLFKYGVVSQIFLIAAVIYLMAKGVIFFRNIASLLDFGVAIIFALALFQTYNVLTWIALVWVLQKAVFSLLG
ncbi:MAG: hypothetical protein Q8O03_06155 [Nanoarchaeota archaeon]|nr:hypothetical protein [Nanoarchaeota archaeon]